MRSIERRVQKLEDKLNVSKEPGIVKIVHYSELPPEQTEDDTTIYIVMYDEKAKQCEASKDELKE